MGWSRSATYLRRCVTETLCSTTATGPAPRDRNRTPWPDTTARDHELHVACGRAHQGGISIPATLQVEHDEVGRLPDSNAARRSRIRQTSAADRHFENIARPHAAR